MDDTRSGHRYGFGGDESSPFDSLGKSLNSVGAVNSNTTDLERVFTKDGLCASCSSPLRIDGDNKIKIGWCTNEKCGKTFTNVVPTANGMKLIDEMVEFRDIL